MEHVEEIQDIPGSEHLYLTWGDRFRSWYLTKTFVRKQSFSFDGFEYAFTISDFNFRFIMPPKIEFPAAIISYSEAERLFGVFRFPRDENGVFCSPISLPRIEEVITLNDQELKNLLNRNPPLAFMAYKIPQYGFEFPDVNQHNLNELKDIAGETFLEGFQDKYRKSLEMKMVEVKCKIESTPNYLLILENVLNRYWKDLREVSQATNGIITIE